MLMLASLDQYSNTTKCVNMWASIVCPCPVPLCCFSSSVAVCSLVSFTLVGHSTSWHMKPTGGILLITFLPVRADFISIPSMLSPHEGLNEEMHLQDGPVCSDTTTTCTSDGKSREPHVCSYCGKGFKHKSFLEKHLRTHTGERPFACHLCPMAFAHKESVARHVRTHTGEKPFHCRFCPAAFATSWQQKKHEVRWHLQRVPHNMPPSMPEHRPYV
ncbi:zinc finger protein 574-like [Rhipicephalus sanguineus]|uniref:zinc finger protein 574-like n=1 Tax=Rhipicephalus sanguineus TaxID=34632 RepID=UPI001894B937|nr:zinc finger protein 574-like [Rhipicephalus sanguineus]